MKSSSSCGSRGSSLRRRSGRPSHPRRRERRRSRPTLIPCTNAEALCMGRQKLFLTCEPASSTASRDRKSTRLNSSHITISYAVFCLKKKKKKKKENAQK